MIRSSPQRGDVWLVDLRGGRGSEQRELRPVVVIQNDVGNTHAATTVVATITSTIRLYPVTVALERGEGGVSRRSMVNLSQIFTIDKGRLARRLGGLPSETMQAVNRAIRISLDVE